MFTHVHPHMHRGVRECVSCGCEAPGAFLITHLSPSQLHESLGDSLFFPSIFKIEV